MHRQTPPAGEGFGRHHRLRRRKDFLRCYQRGRKRHGSLASLHVHLNGEQGPRLGMTVSRKVGKAVVRQRVKRRIREIYRRWQKREMLPSLDVVVHLKPAAAAASFEDLKRELERLLSTFLPPAETCR
ncbi:MAG: ribonuclease P protein component [Thermoanaerobaculia bacterium]|nr:ribonuclease P protein component [Thermoanaerobaculia bacterium]